MGMADHGERVAIDMNGITYLGEIAMEVKRENKAPVIMLHNYMVRPTSECLPSNKDPIQYYLSNRKYCNAKGSVTLDLETRTAIYKTY